MGLPVAVPALTSAMGGAVAASTVAAPALLTAASVAAPMAALTSFSPALISGGGGIFGGGGLLSGATLMDGIFGATSILSSLQSLKQGDILKNQYEIESLQALTKMEMDSYNATVQSMERFDKLRRIQAANLAKSYSGGVNGLDGSALLKQITNDQEYGKDAKIDQFNIDNIATTGKINASILKTAAKDAVTTSRIDAGVKLGEAAYSYKKLYG
tara:strand:+ start:1251 stop:1892 length:642 start_codon:yes stop_codon:yes gene_type:complete